MSCASPNGDSSSSCSSCRWASSFTRRVVLATNVAETSLTVPGIKYVIDPGTARISRYSYRTKVQRLPIEPISQASANQRKGRCGRTSDGICIRLYSEEDFESRPEFTDPEILRTNLASVILQMAAIGTGVGLMVGIVLAGAKEMKNTSLKNLKDVRAYTNLPVLSSIPLLENALLVRRKRRLFWLAWSSAIIIGTIAMSGSMFYYFSSRT